jgi:hypothetical protein
MAPSELRSRRGVDADLGSWQMPLFEQIERLGWRASNDLGNFLDAPDRAINYGPNKSDFARLACFLCGLNPRRRLVHLGAIRERYGIWKLARGCVGACNVPKKGG